MNADKPLYTFPPTSNPYIDLDKILKEQEEYKKNLVICSDDSVYTEETGCCLIEIFKKCFGKGL